MLKNASNRWSICLYIYLLSVGKQGATEGPLVEVWKRISSNQDKYFVRVSKALQKMLHDGEAAVMIQDYTSAIMSARATGFCNWGMLKDRYMPLGYGIAFPQGSPYKEYFDTA